MFGGELSQSQVDGCEIIIAASSGMPISHVAYILATAFHETGRLMQPIKETVSASHTNKNPSDATVVNRLNAAFEKGQLKWVRTPYWDFDESGKSWFGRGYVQLTHKSNYIKAASKLGVDMDVNPDLAMVPTVAARVLIRGCDEGWFTGKKLSDYLPGDYVGARRIVNGTDKASTIASYAKQFEVALDAMKDAPAIVDVKPKTFWDFIWDLFK
jgi:predicted chitinase